MLKIGVIDYGVGNLGSVLRALEELGVLGALLTSPSDIHQVDGVVLPGVGNFSDCASLLQEKGWTSVLREQVIDRSLPLLGICVGMQLLADEGTEGASDGDSVLGLGLVPGRVVHLGRLGCTHRIPHVGWNAVYRSERAVELLSGIPDGTDFYFVHSYAFVTRHAEESVAFVEYDVPLTACVQRGHIWGTQFHPEKSSRAGFVVLSNFIERCKC